ncbi:protein phosphatase 2C-like domain-containing protein 1 isoform X1 [Alligator mississippiensis]|uniref:protein phosphatase 2C-like domain-containing protein 1 isoform X1 n=1 Tax=Alligator mississippiensis TaxID=8496 RepID=UPI002877C9C0|nr:protein phosphatase 2C-like domain-containing protein 1 isoform X1 [Alligator mississippiensis]XP_059584852.1 protein phosphatase 2C-like domain-containing protein 1 isoform X1 [Alligator mississippiensis]
MTGETKLQRKSKTSNFQFYEEDDDHVKVTTVPGKVDSEDIPVLCSTCQQTIYPSHLHHHKKEHKALMVLGFSHPWSQTDTKTLLTRRWKLIRRLLKSSEYNEREKQKIDYSFELLKGRSKCSSYYDTDNIVNSCRYPTVRNSLIKALAVCQDKNAMWRPDMEDTFVVVDNYGNKSDRCFLGVLDGWHGMSAAETVSTELPLLFLDQLSQADSSYKVHEDEQTILNSFSTVIKENYREQEKIFFDKTQIGNTASTNTYEWIHKAYAKAFWRMDRLLQLGRNEVSKVRWSGCTAVTCLLERVSNGKPGCIKKQDKAKLPQNSNSNYSMDSSISGGGILHVANTGNVHAVLCKHGKGYCLTKEHSTSNLTERTRILQNGGNISTNEPKGLVEGLIRATRGLGHHGDPKLKKSVIPVPHTTSIPVDESCQFLILASNGLWEVLDKSEVVKLTLTMFTYYLEMYKHAELEFSVCKQQDSMVPSVDDLMEEVNLLYFNKNVFLNQSEDSSKQNDASSHLSNNRRHLQNEDKLQSGFRDSLEKEHELDDHRKQRDTEVCLSDNHRPCSQNTEIIQLGSITQEHFEVAEKLEDVTEVGVSNNRESHSQTAGRGRNNSETFYEKAANYISKQLVKTAVAAGSRENITILVVLLNGCDKIPNYISI